jgi:hypothetical protein
LVSVFAVEPVRAEPVGLVPVAEPPPQPTAASRPKIMATLRNFFIGSLRNQVEMVRDSINWSNLSYDDPCREKIFPKNVRFCQEKFIVGFGIAKFLPRQPQTGE